MRILKRFFSPKESYNKIEQYPISRGPKASIFPLSQQQTKVADIETAFKTNRAFFKKIPPPSTRTAILVVCVIVAVSLALIIIHKIFIWATRPPEQRKGVSEEELKKEITQLISCIRKRNDSESSTHAGLFIHDQTKYMGFFPMEKGHLKALKQQAEKDLQSNQNQPKLHYLKKLLEDAINSPE